MLVYQHTKKTSCDIGHQGSEKLKAGPGPGEQQGGGGCYLTQEGLSEKCFEKNPEGSEENVGKYLQEEHSRQ